MSCPASSVLALIAVATVAATVALPNRHQGRRHWEAVGRSELEAALRVRLNEGRARNVVLFVGDGMGPNTITASRIYRAGEDSSFVFEQFPHVGILKTYSVDKQVPDSASTATALFCGVKNNHETLGVDSSVILRDCPKSLNESSRLNSIITWGQEVGKGTGFVTTTRVTHATPAALYAHSADRKWECETSMPPNATACKDIARQLIEDAPGRNMQVIMGGGRQCLSSSAEFTTKDPVDTWGCVRQDGKDLIKEWILQKESQGTQFVYADKTEDLLNLDYGNTDYLLGIFANSHIAYDHARDKSPQGMPSLEQMTVAAVKMLLKHEEGFVLVVEGGLIDLAHHRSNARKAIEETIGFNDAINATMKILEENDLLDETLVVVTSDHTHTLSINGYPARGNNILGIAQKSKLDGVPYTTLSYGVAGKNAYHFSAENGVVIREDPSTVDTMDYNYSHQAAILTDENTHGGGDIAVYATGPMAHLFHSVHEQNYVATVISYAARIGAYQNLDADNSSSSSFSSNLPYCICLYFIIYAVFWNYR